MRRPLITVDSVDDTVCEGVAHFFVAEAKNLCQHLKTMLAERWRWSARSVVIAGDEVLMAGIRSWACLGMVKNLVELPVLVLWICNKIAAGLYRARRNACPLEQLGHLLGGARSTPGAKYFVNNVVCRKAVNIGRVLSRKIRLAYDFAERLPLGIGVHGDDTPLVFPRTAIAALGRRMGRAITEPCRGVAVDLQIKNLRRKKMQRSFELSHVQIAAFARASFVIERCSEQG